MKFLIYYYKKKTNMMEFLLRNSQLFALIFRVNSGSNYNLSVDIMINTV